MSEVSGVILCCACSEDETEEDGPVVLFVEINKWLGQRNLGRMERLEEAFGGGKWPQMFVAGGGFNYLREDEFSEFVMALPWKSPEAVVLLINPENGDPYVVRPKGF